MWHVTSLARCRCYSSWSIVHSYLLQFMWQTVKTAVSERVPSWRSSPARCNTVRSGRALFDSKDGRKIAQSVFRVFEVERQPENYVQRRLGIAVTPGVEVPRSAPDTAAGIGPGRGNALCNESTLYPWSHDLCVDLGRVVHNKVRSADHVLEVVARWLHAKVCKHACNILITDILPDVF